MATPRQIEANRNNALRSTGPSPEARDRTRRNALKHGLAGRGVVLPFDLEHDVAERIAQWTEALKPADHFQAWAVAQAALESIRVERCQQQEADLRALLALGAELSWDEIRALDAAELAERLRRSPALVRRQLRKTVQGCELLLERWSMLTLVLHATGGWDDAQRAVAFDLLGVPVELRPGSVLLDPPPDADPVAYLNKIAEDEVAALEKLQQGVLAVADAAEREAAQEGRYDDAELKRLRRYESSCMGRLRWAVAQLTPAPTEAAEAPAVTVGVAVAVAEVAAAPAAAAAPPPMRDLPDSANLPVSAELVEAPAPTVAVPAVAESPRLEPGSRRARRARRRAARRR
jgi:hypothetical protein